MLWQRLVCVPSNLVHNNININFLLINTTRVVSHITWSTLSLHLLPWTCVKGDSLEIKVFQKCMEYLWWVDIISITVIELCYRLHSSRLYNSPCKCCGFHDSTNRSEHWSIWYTCVSSTQFVSCDPCSKGTQGYQNNKVGFRETIGETLYTLVLLII